ncbi:MAG: bifunctional 4-hydroxy-3-methylbut-2-enyl diphosphate reductase/30S ribosomal protein S1 [Oscillospiraceae bacterium]|nr:bifunctional 4-hydroxy-3-methylbut-2-enyl diphosphate reductase/30S ribosomal protein S1 [Oscillospiraceae bacterium]
MAEIKVAESAGFCFGVDRAVKLVYSEIEKGNKNVATLGPIIHNADVVNDLQSKGVRIVDSVADLRNDETAVIRSHGVGRDIYCQLEKKGNPYIDATCPFVARIHKIVREKTNDGYFILIAGDKKHPEVQGIVGHCDENCFVFKDEFELREFFSKKNEKMKKKLAIVAQTTYNILVWGECIKVIPNDDENILVFDTICNATSQRQSDASLLSKEVDAMIVVGGKNSSNTIKLYNVCCENCPSYHIENARELYELDLNNADKIGITAGASTPAYIIKEVQNTMDEIFDFEKELEQSFKKVHTGERVKGYIAAVNNSEAIVDIGTKHTGYVPLAELTDDQTKKPSDIVSVGDEVDLIVTKINDQEGIVMLSKKKVDELVGFDNIAKAKDEDVVLEGTVLNVVKGGILVSVDGVRVFVPASQTGLGRDKNLDELLKKNVELKIIEVNESRRRAVGSIKAVTKAQKEAAKAAFWETAEEGKTYKGEVKSLTSYGAFVDLGGIDGMVHISELSWSRIKHPNQVVKVGDILEVYIKELDKEAGRISLGYKKAEDNPWTKFQDSYNVGDVVKATIVSITPFGAFAKIIEGVDGLIHISQIADKRVDNVNEVLSVGQEVDVKITEIDIESKRISISIRALLENAAEEADAE